LREKLELLRSFGVVRAYIARFDGRLAALAPEVFIHDVLERRIGVRWVLVGDDFRFGHKRAGDLATLRANAARFSVEAMHTVEVDGERVSSSAVRAALLDGDIGRATRLLGRPYAISGHVAHGEKIGRRLGFPTANLPLKHIPALSGVFAVRVHGLAVGAREGVASLGVRPTVRAGGHPLLEVFILDFDAPIYGARIRVEFLHKLRDEARYPDLDTLARKIGEDVAQARDWFHAANAA
jgi:riboflavin kinase/FMN adenylyltransferase